MTPGETPGTPGEAPLETAPPERAAAMVAGITIASRAVGFLRVVVATAVLGVTYLGNTYATSNSVPNLIFEIFAGGALAAVVVPALAAPLARRDRRETEDTASAIANLALLVLTPLVLAGLIFRGPIMAAFTSGVTDASIRDAERDLGEFLLLFFLPQAWLYAVGIVLTGLLHAHRKFGWPAIAPLLSSVVVTISYLLFAVVEGPSSDEIHEISRAGRFILGAGTTAGVAALTLSLLIPAARLRLRWRPVIRLSSEASRTVGRLLSSAVIAVAGQHLLLALVLVIANRVEGGVVAYQLAFAVLLLPWATLAVPIAMASFPGMADAAAREDDQDFATRCSASIRTTSVLVFGGAALLAALGGPASRAILAFGAAGGPRAANVVIPAVIAFAPGLIGYGLYALLTRVAYARGDGRSPAFAAVLAFGLAAIIDVVAVNFVSGPALVAALAVGFSVGMIAGALYLLFQIRSSAGTSALDGVPQTIGRSLVSGVVTAAAGMMLNFLLPRTVVVWDVAACFLIAAIGVVVYLGLLRFMGDREIGRALTALRTK
jgi:putative peptidoglycan lipid II flippase